MEKLILVVYVGIDSFNRSDVFEYLEEVHDHFKDTNDIIHYIIATSGKECHIECLNPKLVSEDDYKQAKELLERNQNIVDDLVKSFKNNE